MPTGGLGEPGRIFHLKIFLMEDFPVLEDINMQKTSLDRVEVQNPETLTIRQVTSLQHDGSKFYGLIPASNYTQKTSVPRTGGIF